MIKQIISFIIALLIIVPGGEVLARGSHGGGEHHPSRNLSRENINRDIHRDNLNRNNLNKTNLNRENFKRDLNRYQRNQLYRDAEGNWVNTAPIDPLPTGTEIEQTQFGTTPQYDSQGNIIEVPDQ